MCPREENRNKLHFFMSRPVTYTNRFGTHTSVKKRAARKRKVYVTAKDVVQCVFPTHFPLVECNESKIHVSTLNTSFRHSIGLILIVLLFVSWRWVQLLAGRVAAFSMSCMNSQIRWRFGRACRWPNVRNLSLRARLTM